jgi:hypothetical protein
MISMLFVKCMNNIYDLKVINVFILKFLKLKNNVRNIAEMLMFPLRKDRGRADWGSDGTRAHKSGKQELVREKAKLRN